MKNFFSDKLFGIGSKLVNVGLTIQLKTNRKILRFIGIKAASLGIWLIDKSFKIKLGG